MTVKNCRRAGGFLGGTVVALTGLVLFVNAAATYALRAAHGPAGGEAGWTAAIRGGMGCALVLVGFTVMVLCTSGVDAEAADLLDAPARMASAMTAEDILCGQCGAGNDHLARYCDQCGRRL